MTTHHGRTRTHHVQQNSTARHGDIVAALPDDKATVKRLHRQDGQVLLMPHNPAYQPIPGDGATILGKVVTVMRTI
ncbi:LexA family protein [Streptomyces microflavus]|uniref:LexA family protein n=1 Tax=Streptomyces microflavus TaxID=1919 RepID=UPI0036758E1D